jgi:hypothetical protein
MFFFCAHISLPCDSKPSSVPNGVDGVNGGGASQAVMSRL